jgi:hypothetical protein
LAGVGDAVEHYHTLLFDRHLDAVRDVFRTVTERYKSYRQGDLNRPHYWTLRPTFVEKSAYEGWVRATTLVNRAIGIVGERLLADKTLRQTIGIPGYLDDLLEIDRVHGEATNAARIDGLIGQDGDIHFIEYNGHPGVTDIDVFGEALNASPIASAFAERFPYRLLGQIESFARALRAETDEEPKRRDKPPVIGVAKFGAAPHWEVDMQRMFEGVQAFGCELVAAPLKEFTYQDGKLTANGTQVDLVILDWELVAGTKGAEPILAAFRDGAARAFHGISRALLYSYKSAFEILTDPVHAGLFEPDVAEALAKHVPWTRAVRDCKTDYHGQNVDLLELIAKHRERFVMKPSGGGGGLDILIGGTLDDAAWQKGLKRASKMKYVVQERVALKDMIPYPALRPDGTVTLEEFSHDFNPFVWRGGRADSALVRLMNTTAGKGLHNVATGASLSLTWILD